MKKVYNSILALSPKKLALYLILGPLVLFLIYTITTISYRNITETTTNKIITNVIFNSIFACLGLLLLLWLFWLRTTVYAIKEKQLRLNPIWFTIAFIFLCFFILFNCCALIIEYVINTKHWSTDYMYLINSSREFINFGGIIIAYPLICFYAARATMVKRNNSPITLLNTIPFTLLLIFGTVIGIPFLHKYFSTKNSTPTQIIGVYAIALGICTLLFIIGFIAAIIGVV